MKISTSTYGVIKTYGLETGTKMLADAGFQAVDYSLTQNAIRWDECFLPDASMSEFAEYFKRIARIIRSNGLEINQGHAPYGPTNADNFDIYSPLQKNSIRSIYAAAYMECPYMVAHPVLHTDFCNGQNRERGRQVTLDYFAPMVPALKDTGVTMCIENLFFTLAAGQPKVTNVCSTAEELCYVIDTLNDMYGPHFAACLDTGHAVIAGQDPCQMLKTLGHRTKVLHIHDNGGSTDDHLIPTRGVIPWKTFAETLGEVNYNGTFNFEITTHFTDFPKNTYSKETFQQACNLLYAIGHSLADIAEGKHCAE